MTSSARTGIIKTRSRFISFSIPHSSEHSSGSAYSGASPNSALYLITTMADAWGYRILDSLLGYPRRALVFQALYNTHTTP